MSPVYHWALAIVRIGRRFSWAELQLAANSFRRGGCDEIAAWRA